MQKEEIRNLAKSGFTIIPLHPKSKIPMVKWRNFQWARPSPEYQMMLIDDYDTEHFAVVTGPSSNVMVLDLDTPLNEDVVKIVGNDAYVRTPSGGRHYYYVYRKGDNHGIGVRPQVDIPRIAKLYESPVVNLGNIPINAAPKVDYVQGRKVTFDGNPPHIEDIRECAFIQWYQEHRDDHEWDGRYPLARAYASNIAKVIGATADDYRLGQDYQHEHQIYSTIAAPIKCFTFYQQFKCPYMSYDGQCMKASATSPIGLAKRVQWKRLVQMNKEPPK